MNKIASKIDESVNFIIPMGAGFLESRYVRRSPDYFCCYLSSQSGCNRGCGFCWLTSTGQTMMDQALEEDFVDQVDQIFKHYVTRLPAYECNFNFMARGEALCNPLILDRHQNHKLFEKLTSWCQVYGELRAKFNISTIMPATQKQSLSDIFVRYQPNIYYSLYSLDREFRDKWLPGALNPYMALDMLEEYQRFSQKIIKLHWSYINDENDSIDSTMKIAEELNSRNLVVDINLVRYNAPDTKSTESPEGIYERNRQILMKMVKRCKEVRTIQRVGPDCKASCGQFITKDDI